MQSGQAKTKMNGQAGPARYAKPVVMKPLPMSVVAPPVELPDAAAGPLGQTMYAVQHYGARCYAEGMRRAAHLVSVAIGRLDGESKERISGALEQLEAEADSASRMLRKPL